MRSSPISANVPSCETHAFHVCTSICNGAGIVWCSVVLCVNKLLYGFDSDPSRNLVLESLRDNPNRKTFGEKLMLLVNREEDPVPLKEPLVPDSMTKLCIDLFSDRSTAGLLYTSDFKVLVDIIARNLSDRGPGDEVRCKVVSLSWDRACIYRCISVFTCVFQPCYISSLITVQTELFSCYSNRAPVYFLCRSASTT